MIYNKKTRRVTRNDSGVGRDRLSDIKHQLMSTKMVALRGELIYLSNKTLITKIHHVLIKLSAEMYENIKFLKPRRFALPPKTVKMTTFYNNISNMDNGTQQLVKCLHTVCCLFLI